MNGRPVELCGELCGPYSLADLDKALGVNNGPADFELRNSIPPTVARTRMGIDPQSLAAAAVSDLYDDGPADIVAIATSCGLFQWFEQARGVIPEPTWRDLAIVSDYCGEQGADYFHRISAGDSRYDRAETDDKIHRHPGTGPTRCDTLEGSSAEAARICLVCPYRGHISTPVQLGRAPYTSQEEAPQVEEVTDTEDTPPPTEQKSKFKYEHGEMFMVEDRKGRAVDPFLSGQVELIAVLKAETSKHETIVVRFQRYQTDKWEVVRIDQTKEFTNALCEVMQSKGIMVHNSMQFRAFVREQQKKIYQQTQICYESFGLKPDGFLFGNRLYNETGVHEVYVDRDAEFRADFMQLAKTASLTTWSRLIETFFCPGMEAHVLTILASAAGPLMRFLSTTEGGGIFHTCSPESGRGKSMSLWASLSIWGHKTLNLDTQDTANSRYNVMGTMGNLPITWNEMPVNEHSHEFVLTFDTGTPKKRLDPREYNVKYPKGKWATILISNSNMSLFDYLQSNKNTDAQAWRVMEFYADLVPGAKTLDGDRIRNQLFEHAGTAGDALLRHMFCIPGNLDRIKQRLDRTYETLETRTNWPQYTRYWLRMLAAMTVAGEILYELEIIPEKPHSYINWAVMHQDMKLRQTTISNRMNDAVESLITMLNEWQSNTLVVRGGDMLNGSGAVYPVSEPKGPLYARREEHTGLVYVSERAFRRWTVDNTKGWRETRLDLFQQKVAMREVGYDLGHGTKFSTGIALCIVFNLRHSLLLMKAPEHEEPAGLIENEPGAESWLH